MNALITFYLNTSDDLTYQVYLCVVTISDNIGGPIAFSGSRTSLTAEWKT